MLYKTFQSSLILFSLCFSTFANALSLNEEVSDNYVGASTANPASRGSDVIGNVNVYDISKASIHFDPNNEDRFTVNIFTKAVGYGLQEDVQFGDLFISTDGWHPHGDAPYVDDNHFNGESWEYAMKGTSAFRGSDGDVSRFERNGNESPEYIYRIDQNAIGYTSSPDGGDYRAGQEFQYLPTTEAQRFDIVGNGFVRVIEAGEYDILSFSLHSRFLVQDIIKNGSFSFHWTTGRGNDVIEGSVAVPEPATLFLLAPALWGVRRKTKISPIG